jgi:hypothetical protein
MPVNKKSFKTLEPIFFETIDKDTELVKNTFSTSQGLTLNKYKFFENLNDFKVKNYSVNVLTDEIDFNDFFKYDLNKNFNFLDYNTTLAFNGLDTLSAASYLSFSRIGNFGDSDIYFDYLDNGEDQFFLLDFIDDKFCTIKCVDNGIEKYLSFTETSPSTPIKFSILNSEYIQISSFLFEYDFNREKLFITLFKTLTSGNFKVLAPLSGELTLQNPTNETVKNGVIKLSDQQSLIGKDDINSFVFYDKNKKISDETLKNRKNNFLGWFPYEITSLSGDITDKQSQRFINSIDFFNLRNQLSNDSFVNPLLPLSSNQTSQRKYTSLLNVDNKEFENEEILLGYNFYTKEYNFLPDKYTKFTLPDTLFPFRRLNINDSNLSKAGSLASNSPYFSDKVFKLLDSNKNVNSGAGDLNNLFLLENSSFLLLQNGFKFGNEDYNDPQATENSGTFLCSWLSGNEYEEGIWYDRYYNPQKASFLNAITGTQEQAFEYRSQAKQFFSQNGIDSTFYDIKSNLVFQPSSTYYYQRVGNKYINDVITGLDYRVNKDTFNIKLSGQELLDRNELVFDSKGYDITDFNLINPKDFNISFDLKLDKLDSLDTYQMIGNLYQDGFSLKNNFYFTPFIFLPQDNRLYIYDNNFNLLTENEYPSVSAINDVIYIEQHNNIVLVCNDRIIKTSFTGEILDQRLKNVTVFGDRTINSILSGYKNRYFYGYNKTLFLTEGSDVIQDLDLNSLSLSSSINLNLSSGSSIIQNGDGDFISLIGYNGRYLSDKVGVSLSGAGKIDTVLFENITEQDSTNLGSLSTNNNIYDINTFDEKLYIQSFDNENKGYVHVFSSERDLLSTINLSTSAVSGVNLDFTNEDGEIKLLSFSRTQDYNIIVDKISLETPFDGGKNYILPISSNNISFEVNRQYVNPVNFHSIYYKFKDKQNKLHFVVSLDSFIDSKESKRPWNLADYTYTNPASSLSGWDGKFLTTNIDGLKSEERFIELKNLKLKNEISINFKLNDGLIDIHLNGELLGEIKFTPNKRVLERITFPDIFYNVPNIKNNPISKLVNTDRYFGKGGTISNFKLYDSYLAQDFIKFLHLKDKKIDNLNFDITCGTRNNLEEMNNIYNVNLPGRKNNNIKIYVKNANLSEFEQEEFTKFLNNKIKRVLPFNIENTQLNYDINF